jgi:hypothetical protein
MDGLNPWHILSAVSTALVGLLAWLGVKQVSRIDTLEREKAGLPYVIQEIAGVKSDIRELAVRTDRQTDAVTGRLDDIMRVLIK